MAKTSACCACRPSSTKLAQPILIGRPSVIEMRIKKFGLRMTPGVNLEIVDPEDDGRERNAGPAQGREGVPAIAKAMIRFGVVPKIALLSHSNFGSRQTESSRKMAAARQRAGTRARPGSGR